MYYLIVNPASQSGHSHAVILEKIKAELRSREISYQVLTTGEDGDAGEIASGITRVTARIRTESNPSDSEDDTIVVIGGDGTINGMINGIRDFSHIKFGFIPAGSANDMAKGLGIPDISRDSGQEDNIRKIAEGKVLRKMDLGQIIYGPKSKSRLFAVSAGIGFDAAVCRESDVSGTRGFFNTFHLGRLTYGTIALKQLLSAPEVRCDILLPGKTEMWNGKQKAVGKEIPLEESEKEKSKFRFEEEKKEKSELCLEKREQDERGPVVREQDEQGTQFNIGNEYQIGQLVFATFMNTPYEGGGYKFAPDAVCDDGLINVSAIGDLSKFTVLVNFPSAHKGTYYRVNGVYHAKAPFMDVRTDQPLWVHTDGEVIGRLKEFRIRCLPQKLRLIM